MRGQWFIDGTWQPLEEEESNLIEQEHLDCFKGQQMPESFDMEVAKPVDGKEGKRWLAHTACCASSEGPWALLCTWQDEPLLASVS